MDQAIVLRVEREPYGWAVRLPTGRMMPFRSRRLARRHALRLAERLHSHGREATVETDETWPTNSPAWRRTHRRPALSWLLPRSFLFS